MPFVKKINIESGILGIWEFTESASSLISGFPFSEAENTEFKQFKFEKRQKEYLATRLLLNKLLGAKTEIIYHHSGRPLIKNPSQRLSISHSAELAVVFVSDKPAGIDVECINRNIEKVTRRFLNPTELNWVDKTDDKQFLKIMLWCAKEAVFKCSQKNGVQFDKQILIPPFNFTESSAFTGTLTSENQTEHYELHYIYFRNNIIVYCIENENSIK